LVSDQAWCWGWNGHGQLGDGTTEDRYTPVPMAYSEDATSITVGRGHICTVRMDGTAWCLGLNESGQVGDGTFADRWAPVEVELVRSP
jgi:alpha-tubulin suppressor-like RCC1 family protein